MKHPIGQLYANENWEADYWKGELILTELANHDYYTIVMKDAWTGQNITRFSFKECVEKYGLDRACETFKKMSPEWKASLVHPDNLKLNLNEVA
tara:strand:- start:210 stop:491 length:282 start_codon:yes stop_codon:yes gene_type:complete